MSDPYFQTLFADRIGGAMYGKGTAIYKFEKIKRAKRAAIADFPDRPLLDFGIGENDDMAAESVRAVMKAEVDKLENRGYADNGIQAFKDAAAAFMQREFGVKLDPVTQINHCIGTKPALAMLPACFINPGDITLMTVPGYPVAGTHTRYYGGQVFSLPLLPENKFFPDLDAIPEDIARRAKMLVINYPNSPTGQVADEAFYRKVIDFALRHKVVVVQDAAHILLTYGRKPLSFLQVDGAMEVGVEVHSMSKGFDMIGWRMGFVAGHPLIVRAFADVKDNSDSGQFMATQKAAAAALNDPSIPVRIRTKYERRLRKLVATLREIGFQAEMPGGTYFLYTPAPRGLENGPTFASAEDASQFLIRERSICTVPWDDAGPHLRWSVTYIAPTEADEDALMTALKQRLAGDRFVWS
ncbi:MAG TPA: LL-diaminopimelate aminotransferase [Phycisphaerae bacterium]|nr:LL-diaminopimelate aminotransferase [Phycisphaerae bacterium]HOJ75560.1 LL-diaminopimelate aminotransferase [Phycisphaerae bacterium]HOM50214.1 LL-diaminopimelate aminotransferase [Phycisphaerae bacterium]HON65026.1 LL-diaminopimelate aminotransferase [Phycisphaerae bacterium]HPP27519.1 LL-diaminopimelate aminotransferase [Phycisphaerae bacterium]